MLVARIETTSFNRPGICVVSDVLFDADVADMRRANVRTLEMLLLEGSFLLQQIMKTADVCSKIHFTNAFFAALFLLLA